MDTQPQILNVIYKSVCRKASVLFHHSVDLMTYGKFTGQWRLCFFHVVVVKFRRLGCECGQF